MKKELIKEITMLLKNVSRKEMNKNSVLRLKTQQLIALLSRLREEVK